MFNTGLKWFENRTVNDFTSDVGLFIRKKINFVWRNLIRLFVGRKMYIEQYPKLEKDKPYIFVGNHSFDEDIISILSTIDRNAYLLSGSTHQMEHNPLFYAVWANGMVYVNRLDKLSRADAIPKMERVLRAGNSVFIFAEGGYNNTENQLIQPLFASPYILSEKLGVEVVPIISFCKDETKEIFVRAGEPMKLGEWEKGEALARLRDAMATIVWDIMEEHGGRLVRKELYEPREMFLEERKNVYACQKWYADVWDEELTYYPGHGVTTPQQARECVDKVVVTAENAWVLAETLVRRDEDRRYDLKRYLREKIKLQV